MNRRLAVLVALGAFAACLVVFGGTAAAGPGDNGKDVEMSGAVEMRDFGFDITECPQAGLEGAQPKPLDQRQEDKVEQLSSGGGDIRLNQDYACLPHDEMSIAINPTNAQNVLGGANDYRLGWGSSGFYASTDGGQHWYDGITAFPTPGPGAPNIPGDDHLDGGGDPLAMFDREGVAYYGQIHFERERDDNGIFVNRSTNGGFTWSRPCVPFGTTDASAVCGGAGDPRHPGDGVVSFFLDPDGTGPATVPFEDKEYGTTGPRPAGVSPVCFAPISKTPRPAGSPGCPASRIGVDRIYVTWTRFDLDGTSKIYISFSDDQARSWSPPKAISGSAPFCAFGRTPNACDSNQGSQPVVNPHTGVLYVTWENFNTPDENQYLLVRSKDGGATFEGPFFVTPVFDVNYAVAGGPSATRNRPDCTARGQGAGRRVLTNSCFRVNARGAIAVDKRGGAHADDLYLIIADNRNGTRVSTNTDVQFFRSSNGGETWVGPTRVNDDPSAQPANRNCGRTGRPPCPPGVHTGNDQFYPWLDVGENGDIQIVWQDRRLDTDSTSSEWPTSRTRPGNYLLWFWGGHCGVRQADSNECVAPTAGLITQPTAPIDPPDTLTFPEQTVFPFDNFGISDTTYNWDYCFRAGIFCGDYENVAIDRNNRAWAMWTDARNGRSSRTQQGRNPACEQSDVYADRYSASSKASGQNKPGKHDELFVVTPCPGDFE